MDVASFLGMSLSRCKREHTIRQRDDWLHYIQHHHTKGFHRNDDYLAKILCELRLLRIPKAKAKWTDFRITYEFKRKKSKPKQDPAVTKAILHATLGISNGANNGTTGTPGGS
jgi:hypothetical protein